MKFIIIAIVTTVLLAPRPAFAGAEDLKTSLDDQAHSGYFDAHTHWPGGILLWKAYGKMVPGFQDPRDQALLDKAHPTQAEYARLVQIYEALFTEIRTALNTDNRLANSIRVNPAARAVAGLTFPPHPEGQAAKTKKLQDLEEALRRLLTSSVRTDYDSAYAVRGDLEDAFTTGSEPHQEQLLDWILLETARNDITYSEQSASLRAVTQNYTPARMRAALGRIRPRLAGKPAPDVHFLIQFTTPWLSQVSEDEWQRATATGLARVKDAAAIKRNEDLLATLSSRATPLNNANVAGVDILSPERNAFSALGKENFKRLMDVVFRQAVRCGKRLVVHAHVGEGYPIADDHGQTPDSLEAPVPAVAVDDHGVPLHYRYAEYNVEQLLDAVEEWRGLLTADTLAEFDNFVVIRFGHVSHATRDQARRMAAAHIWADVNLTSNIATGTLYLDRPDLSRPNVLNYFEDHALVDLMAEDVRVVFGSDGPGVEHVRMANEIVIAQDIFAKIGAAVRDGHGNPMAGKARQYVDQMLSNARAHIAFVQGSPGPPRQ